MGMRIDPPAHGREEALAPERGRDLGPERASLGGAG